MATATDEAQKKGAHAGNLIKGIAAWLAAAAADVRTWHRQAERIRQVSMQPWKEHARLQREQIRKLKNHPQKTRKN